MNTCSKTHDAVSAADRDEELISILTAISVVSKQLAAKLTRLSQQEQQRKEGGRSYGPNGRTCRCRL